jgi:hypothetical protein
MIVETAWFKTKPGVSDADFLAASKQAHDGYLSKCKGFVSRELLKGDDGQWVDLVHFKTAADADAAAQGFPKAASAKAFESAIDPASARMMRFEIVKKY